MTFQNQKKGFLEKLDKSKKGSIDKPIISLIKKINKNPDYYTTSSCSGRILLYIPGKKSEMKWIFVSHEQITLKQIKQVEVPIDDIWFKQEPFIIHISCRTLEHAQKLLNKARAVGFKRSGIQSIRKNIIEISATEHLNLPIFKKGNLLIDENYLKLIIKQANNKLKQTKAKIKRFQNDIS